MNALQTSGIENIKNFDQLFPFLRNELDWPIEEKDFEINDLTFIYDAAKDLGLKEDDIAHIREIRQLRPLETNQPWGVFFINFEDKKIPIGVLKRVLGGLTLKKRESANKAEQKGWDLHDLLFISAHGHTGDRELSFLHFAEEAGSKNKIILKELGWDRQDTKTKLSYVAHALKDKLSWPDDPENQEAWRAQWTGAFTSKHGAAISTAKDLTKKLGVLATRIRISVNEVIEAETANGPLTKIYENFKQTLFHNLDHDGFADMYAQTICYGLLAVQIDRANNGLDTKALTADDVASHSGMILQPFLKDLMETFLAVGGRKSKIDFNELGIVEVVDALQQADMTAVLVDFGNKNRNEDPILHFYEHFLKEYDSIMREQRGVYYTPLPVVKFIVRSVDEILQKEFGLEDGLADTATWDEMIKRNAEIILPKGVNADEPFVQILDPATGTGTFLVEAIDLIEKRMKDKWSRGGKSTKESNALWNDYVPQHLLPRLNGFELMMAPYVIAHIKIGMKLAETGYEPKNTNQRVRVFLTNTLEEPISQGGSGSQMSMNIIEDSLSAEAHGADEIKAHTPITVVIGNPPYSNFGQLNQGNRIKKLLKDYKKNLNEQKTNLDDDYIKFFRHMQNIIQSNDIGILGIITNHTHIDGLTHRQMRNSLHQTFPILYNLELNGSIKKRTAELEKVSDQNVFDIQQGVSISLYVRMKTLNDKASYFSLSGQRQEKYNFLNQKSITSINWTACFPRTPKYYFLPFTNEHGDDWEGAYYCLNKIVPRSSSGIKTHLDPIYVDFDQRVVKEKTLEFLNKNGTKTPLKDTKRSSKERKANLLALSIKNDQEKILHSIQDYEYRAFDRRKVLYIPEAIEAGDHRWPIMQHLINDALALITTRQTSKGIFNHIMVGTGLIDMCYLSTATKECAYCFPFFLLPTEGDSIIRPNLDSDFTNTLAAQIELHYDSGIKIKQANMGFKATTPEQTAMILPDPSMGRGDLTKTFGPRDVFDYIYAVLHSPSYRTRYADFLKSDFPRIPLPVSAKLFTNLVDLGRQLVALHLMDEKEAKALAKPETRFISTGEARVEKGYPKYENGKVMINATCHFEDVTPEIWNFHIGGYQVCEKWLKDRAGKGGKNPRPGRVLSDEDILHYRRITIALRDTIALMTQIDDVINKHGGWPEAFAGSEVKEEKTGTG